jgi:hypothetical protein
MIKWLFGKRSEQTPDDSKVANQSTSSTIDWDEQGTLYHTVGGYKIRTDPLWILVITAMQGHEGDVENMTITMASGLTYGPQEIRALAIRPDRKRA